MQNKLGAAILAAVLLGAGAVPATAQKSADTLRIVMRDALPNIDPYYNNLRTGVVMHHQGWDALVYRNPDTFKLEPLLATEWKLPDPTTIEFTLRPGVKFHDGSPFTADDVVYTHQSGRRSGEQACRRPSNYNWIEKAEKTGDLSVRVKLKRPTPAALEYFALVIPIYPKAYREKVGAEGYAKAPVGAGPYKMTKVEPGVSIDFERFEDYWAGSPKGKPAIKKMSVRFVPDATTEMTELLAGRADWIWNMNPDQFDTVNRMPHLQAVRKESMRIGYLSLDAGRPHRRRQSPDQAQGASGDLARDRPPGDRRQARHRRQPRSGRAVFPVAVRLRRRGRDAVRLQSRPRRSSCSPRPAIPTASMSSLPATCCRNGARRFRTICIAVGIRAKLNQLQTAALIQRAKAGELRVVSRQLGQLFDQRRLGDSCRTSSTAAPTTMRAIPTCRNG